MPHIYVPSGMPGITGLLKTFPDTGEILLCYVDGLDIKLPSDSDYALMGASIAEQGYVW